MDNANSIKKNKLTNLNKVLLIGILIAIFGSWFNLLDKSATNYLNDSLTSAAKSYAVARGMNASISMIQSTEVSVGVASVAIGEALDPLNDIVERFSDTITVVIGSIVIQMIILEIISSTFFKVLLTIFGMLSAFFLLFKHSKFTAIVNKSFIFLLLLRVSMSLVVLLSGTVDHFFLEQRNAYNAEQVALAEEKLQEEARIEAERVDNLKEIILNAEKSSKNLTLQLTKVNADIEKLTTEIDSITNEIEIKDNSGILSSKSEEVLGLEEKKESLEDKLDKLINQKDEIEDRLEEQVEAVADANEELTDGPGFFSTMYSSAKSAVDSFVNFDWSQIPDLINNFLQLMIIWVFKTMILPIVFLLLLLKAFKAIWNIELKEYIGNQSDYLKNQLPSS